MVFEELQQLFLNSCAKLFQRGENMKKITSLLLVAMIVVVSLTGCGKKADSEKSLLETIKERGYINFGTEGTWSPYTYHNESDEDRKSVV